MGFQTILVAFLADLLSANRKLMEDVRYRQYRAAEEQTLFRQELQHEGNK